MRVSLFFRCTYLMKINWICTASFAVFAFIGFTSDFWFYYYYFYYYIISVYILPYHLCSIPLVSFSYHIILCMFLLDIIYSLSTCSSMPVLTTRFSIHALLIRIYQYMCACPCMPHGIHHTTHWGVSDSPGSSCPDPRAWSLWILPVADQRCTAEAWIIGRPSRALSFQASCSALELSLCDSWASFVQFMIVYHFVFSHLRLSVM